MDFSLAAAKVLAIYFVISGLFLIFFGRSLPVVARDLFKHPGFIYITGSLLVLLGLFLIIRNNSFDGTWRTWVTVFGGLTLAKGLMYVFFPQVLSAIPIEKLRPWFKAIGAVIILLGVYLWRIIAN